MNKKIKNRKRIESQLREQETLQIQTEAEREFNKIIDEIYPNKVEEDDLDFLEDGNNEKEN